MTTPVTETGPGAVVAHHIGGRTRLRIPERRGDRSYFEALARTLEGCSGVDEVCVNPLTGSVLVFHHAALDSVWAHAEREGLFTRASSRQPVESVSERLDTATQQADAWLRSQAGRDADLRSVMLAALIVGGVWQTMRGQLLPPGASLLWYAFSLLTHGDPQGDVEQP